MPDLLPHEDTLHNEIINFTSWLNRLDFDEITISKNQALNNWMIISNQCMKNPINIGKQFKMRQNKKLKKT